MLGLIFCLLLLFQIGSEPRTVALHFNNGLGVVIVSLESAEQEHEMLLKIKPEDRTEMQSLRFAALVQALGTVPNNKAIPCPEDHAPRCRVLESGGRRLPTQRVEP